LKLLFKNKFKIKFSRPLSLSKASSCSDISVKSTTEAKCPYGWVYREEKNADKTLRILIV
jgi:hypothetical protein